MISIKKMKMSAGRITVRWKCSCRRNWPARVLQKRGICRGGQPAIECSRTRTSWLYVREGEHEGEVLVLSEKDMKARWFDSSKVRVKLSTPAQMLSRQAKRLKRLIESL